MIHKGNWRGTYSFLDPEMNRIRGFEKTNFEMEISKIEGDSFSGTVQDDLSTGGTEGLGEIEGVVQGNEISFVKRMPLATVLINKAGDRKTFKKKHRPIHYKGKFSDDFKSASGKWKRGFGIIWKGLLPIPLRASEGVWSMTINQETIK